MKEQDIDTVPIGLHAAVIPQADLECGLRAASAAGFSAYEPEAARLSDYSQNHLNRDNALRKSLNLDWGPLNELQVFGEQPLNDKTLDLAVELGISALTVIPEPTDISFDQAVEELRRLQQSARLRGLSVYFEMLCFGKRPFHSAAEALELAGAAGIQLVFDTFHYIVSGARPEEITKIPQAMIGVVHVSDALIQGKNLWELVDEDRVLPGEGDLELVPIMEALSRTGYRRLISVEVFHPKYAKDKPETAAQQAYQRTATLLEQSGWIH